MLASLPIAMAASYSIASVQSELRMTLFNKEVYAGQQTNGVTTIVNGGPIGTTWVFSWPVTDRPAEGADANIVGHLQGTGVQVACSPNLVYHYSLGLVFGHKSRFNGSTLQIQGTSQINGEWSIVGGTGELTMAKGTVKRTQISYMGSTRISELNIHVFYTPMKPTSLEPLRILQSSEYVLRTRTIKYVRVLWMNQSEREVTWELEEQMRKEYPKLFEIGT